MDTIKCARCGCELTEDTIAHEHVHPCGAVSVVCRDDVDVRWHKTGAIVRKHILTEKCETCAIATA